MPLPTCQQYRALKGLDLALHVLLDDAHEARAAELVPTRVQRTRVRSAQRSSRPPEHERHERARAPQRGALQQRASGYLWREDLERGRPGRRLRNALGTHVDQRERGRTEDRCSRRSHRSEHPAAASSSARCFQQARSSCSSVPKFLEVQPRREAANRERPRDIVIQYCKAAPERHAMLLTTRRFDRSVVAKHAILRKHAARALDSRWHRPGVHSAC